MRYLTKLGKNRVTRYAGLSLRFQKRNKLLSMRSFVINVPFSPQLLRKPLSYLFRLKLLSKEVSVYVVILELTPPPFFFSYHESLLIRKNSEGNPPFIPARLHKGQWNFAAVLLNRTRNSIYSTKCTKFSPFFVCLAKWHIRNGAEEDWVTLGTA